MDQPEWMQRKSRRIVILVLILARVRPNFKVDMYSEITKVQQLTIVQYDNDVQLCVCN